MVWAVGVVLGAALVWLLVKAFALFHVQQNARRAMESLQQFRRSTTDEEREKLSLAAGIQVFKVSLQVIVICAVLLAFVAAPLLFLGTSDDVLARYAIALILPAVPMVWWLKKRVHG